MNKSDIEFMKQLQNEMLTQDNCGNIDPRFWVVRGKGKGYGYNEECCDGEELVVNGETIIQTMDEAWRYIKETLDDFGVKYSCDLDGETIYYKDNEYDFAMFDFKDVRDFIADILREDVYIVYYKEAFKVYPDTMFLTLIECEEHIKNNKHHYNNPRPYCMTAWRSPQVERLYKIIQKTNWDEEDKNSGKMTIPVEIPDGKYCGDPNSCPLFNSKWRRCSLFDIELSLEFDDDYNMKVLKCNECKELAESCGAK